MVCTLVVTGKIEWMSNCPVVVVGRLGKSFVKGIRGGITAVAACSWLLLVDTSQLNKPLISTPLTPELVKKSN